MPAFPEERTAYARPSPMSGSDGMALIPLTSLSNKYTQTMLLILFKI